jgi:two-component system KDP operon response regulator KdpE
MTATRVLIVEDDPNIVDLIRSNLLVRGFDVQVSSSGSDALELIEKSEPSVVLLDLMLPTVNGFDLCREIRQQSDVGLIVVSSRADESDKVRALNLGADDYLTKPFDVEELLARMAATLRRSRVTDLESSVAEITFGQIRIDMEAKAVFKNHDRVQLTPTEFSLLRVLALNMGRLMSYRELLREVWGVGYETSREYVRVYVGRLRSKLEEADGPALIVTEPRAGYRLVAPEQQ